jgi:chromosome segregation ATPase
LLIYHAAHREGCRGAIVQQERRFGPGHTHRTLAALEAHIATLKEALAKNEARVEGLERELVEERARTIEAAAIPALRDTISALKTALEGEKARLAEVRAERNQLAARRPWWKRLVG